MFEQQCFDDFVVQQLPYLKRLVCKLTRGDQIADDIVQQTMLKALIHAHQFRFQPSLKTWLSSIAVNEVHQVYRSKWQKSAVPMQTEMVDTQRAQSPYRQDHSYEARERDALVRYGVRRLPRTYRLVIELCDLQELSLNEAAQELGVTVSAVKTRLHRARKKLRLLVVRLK
jgi:RNA polymerase sigma-70 factor, ECF subfamily